MIKEVCLYTCDEVLVEDFECDNSRLKKEIPRLILAFQCICFYIYNSYIKCSG